MTFRELALEENFEEYEFNRAIFLLENTELSENILSNISKGVKNKINFIKDLAKASNIELKKILILFKDSRVFKFFKSISFSFKKLFAILKKGFTNYLKLEHIVTNYIAEKGGVKYVRKNLGALDEYLQKHPIIKKLGGVGVSAILIYIWLKMAYTPDLTYSMSWENMINALLGKFSLADLFASEAGIKMLILFASGALLGLTFPWPGPQMLHIAGGVLYGLYKIIKPKGIKLDKVLIV